MRSRIWLVPDFNGLVAQSSSINSVLRKLGFSQSGFNTVVARIEQEGLDTSHFSYLSKGLKIPLEEILVEHSTYNRGHLKNRLLKEGLLKNECATCGLKSAWQDKPLVLVFDHKNGVRDDARLGNLQLLCPNCNSQTETFAGRNTHGGVSSEAE